MLSLDLNLIKSDIDELLAFTLAFDDVIEPDDYIRKRESRMESDKGKDKEVERGTKREIEGYMRKESSRDIEAHNHFQ